MARNFTAHRDDEILLGALARYDKLFDVTTIQGWIDCDDELCQALGFLRVRLNKTDERRGMRRLDGRTLAYIRRWFARVTNREIAGLMLVQDQHGWCGVKRLEAPT